MENVPLLCDPAAATMLVQEWGFVLELGLTGHSLSASPADSFNFVSAKSCEQSLSG